MAYLGPGPKCHKNKAKDDQHVGLKLVDRISQDDA
jgi:hypothetical protein